MKGKTLTNWSDIKHLTLWTALCASAALGPVSLAWAELPMRVKPASIQSFLSQNPQWRLEAGQLVTQYTCRGGFKMATQFVRALTDPADRLNHHPDLTISYNRVRVSLTTHDVGGVTEADLKLARMVQNIYEQIDASY